jgi:hypothetical protein
MSETKVRDETLAATVTSRSFSPASQSSQWPARAEPTEGQNDGNNYSDSGLGSYSG